MQVDMNDSVELVRAAQDASLALKMVSEQFEAQWKRDEAMRTKVLREFREWRMAMDGEIHKLVASCADVRKFFLGPDHEKEIARLKEFIELCERLQALQKSGMLNNVADVILKLS